MQQIEPVILNPGLEQAEILEWMRRKVSLASQLSAARDHKKCLERELEDIDAKIKELTESSALDILQKD